MGDVLMSSISCLISVYGAPVKMEIQIPSAVFNFHIVISGMDSSFEKKCNFEQIHNIGYIGLNTICNIFCLTEYPIAVGILFV